MQSTENSPEIPKRIKNIQGQTFGRLTVESYAGVESRKAMWNCICTCGGCLSVRGNSLLTGRTRSCGCLQDEVRVSANTKHGMRYSRTYSVWLNMIGRTTNPKNEAATYYLGRGITVCESWRKFENFLEDMGRPLKD